MLGGGRRAMDQAIKWAQTRYQFGRPLADFELVQKRIAHMAALCYAMDAVLYMTTGMLDRGDEDIMLETAICKVFCSEMGWRAVDDAIQIMGGESYMTENEIERIFRDSRINLIVEGANEVMQSFIFAGNLGRIARMALRPAIMRAAVPLAAELFLGVRRRAPGPPRVHGSLQGSAERLARAVQEHSHQFKQASKRYREEIITRQAVQARLADIAMWLHAWACTLSKLDADLRGNSEGPEFERDRMGALHFMDMAEQAIHVNFRELYENADSTMAPAAAAALKFTDTLPNSDFYIPEKSPNAQGTGKKKRQEGIKQFPGDPPARSSEGEVASGAGRS